MGKSGENREKWGKVVENGEKLEKVEKVGISGERWGKLAKSGEKRPFWISPKFQI